MSLDQALTKMVLDNIERKKNESRVMSNEIRVCTNEGCGNLIELDKRTDADKRAKRYKCRSCEKKRKAKYYTPKPKEV